MEKAVSHRGMARISHGDLGKAMSHIFNFEFLLSRIFLAF